MSGDTAVALARAGHELQVMLRRPAVQQAVDERGAHIVEAVTGAPGTLRPLQREVLMRAMVSPLTSIIVPVGTGYGKTLLAPALACFLQRDVVPDFYTRANGRWWYTIRHTPAGVAARAREPPAELFIFAPLLLAAGRQGAASTRARGGAQACGGARRGEGGWRGGGLGRRRAARAAAQAGMEWSL